MMKLLMIDSPARRALLLATVVIVPLAACASLKAPTARLESATVSGVNNGSPSQTEVRIVRGDSVLKPSLSMRLQPGDSIITSAVTRAVLSFSVGYDVFLDTSTAVFIEGATPGDAGGESGSGGGAFGAATLSALPLTAAAPAFRPTAPLALTTPIAANGATSGYTAAPGDSNVVTLFIRFGQAFIRRVLGKTDTLNTQTPQAVLSPSGTAYFVTVSLRATQLRVADGSVVATPRFAGARSVTYGELDGGEIGNNVEIVRMPRISRAALEQQYVWVREVERVTRPTVPSLDSLTETQARATLRGVGLRVLFVTEKVAEGVAPGQVIDQSVRAGERVAAGTFINLVVAKAPPLNPPAGRSRDTRESQCVVPKIVGLQEAAAKALLERARLVGEVLRRTGEIDVITSQRQKADSRVPCGSVVQYNWGIVG